MSGSEQDQPRRSWPIIVAIGWNAALLIVAVASRSAFDHAAPNTRLVISLGGWVLLLGSLAGLLASLVVWGLVLAHGQSGSRWSLLSARILAGLVLGAGVASIGAFVGLFLVPTGVLLLTCLTRRSPGRWYPAVGNGL